MTSHILPIRLHLKRKAVGGGDVEREADPHTPNPQKVSSPPLWDKSPRYSQDTLLPCSRGVYKIKAFSGEFASNNVAFSISLYVTYFLGNADDIKMKGVGVFPVLNHSTVIKRGNSLKSKTKHLSIKLYLKLSILMQHCISASFIPDYGIRQLALRWIDCGCFEYKSVHKKCVQKRRTLHQTLFLKHNLSWRDLWHYSLSPAVRGLSYSWAERNSSGPLLGFRGQKHISQSDFGKLNESSATVKRRCCSNTDFQFSGNVKLVKIAW